MSEKLITLESYNPPEIFGVNDRYLNLMGTFYPKIKLIARGNQLKLIGDDHELAAFERKFMLLLVSYDHFNRISETDIEQIMGPESDANYLETRKSTEVLVHGKNGLQIKARTSNQVKIVECSEKNDMVFAIGPAGTGKTYTAVALAVRALKNREVRRIILTRPAVEAGENLGFLPGDLKDKLDPYLQPLYDALRDMLPPQKLLSYLEDGTIEVAPLAFMRGRTLSDAFAILDEAQNTSPSQLKMFLTRMGKNSKFIVTGDITQVDLPRNQVSGLREIQHVLKDVKGIDFVYLDQRDVVRHALVSRIIEAYQQDEEREKA